jgi:glycosyltransferase involved in cell wall biosynthesis
MALGLPIAASDLEPVREVVEDGRCAELVPPRGSDELAAAIVSLLGDRPRAAALGARGREIYLERFTLERSTERMVELCRRVADPARAHATRDGLEAA